MSLPLPLSLCSLAGLPQTGAPAFSAAVASLRYQGQALGMSLTEAAMLQATGPTLALALHTPGAPPIACDIGGWPDGQPGIATEFTVQAACGLMSVHGRASGRMQPLGVNYVSMLTATLALQGMLAAAVGQRRGLPATQVSTSFASAALLAVGQYIAGATAPEAPEKILPGGASTADRPPFVSADGVTFELETLDAQPWRAFWSEIGVEMDSVGKGWNGFLLRYAKAIAPLPPALSAALARLPYAQVATICARTGVSICPVRALEERSRDPDAGSLLRQGPWAFTREDDAARYATPDSALSPSTGTLPLSGLTVVESCRRIQGPLAGHLLALLGATVVRIEPPGGDPLRGMPPMAGGVSARFDALNRLKSVREIDIKSAQGRAEIHALVRQADVFLHNWAPGKAAELRLDAMDLRRINPALVYAYAGGWGVAGGHNLPGTDFMVQAYSGVAHRIARASGTRGGSLFTVLDVLGGAVAAQGVAAALLSRTLQAGGIRMESSLLGAATMLCADDFDALSHPNDLPPSPSGVLVAIYPTQQGWLAIDCPDAQTAAVLARVVGLDAALEPARLHAHLTQALQAKTAHQWLALLEPCGVAAAIALEDLSELHGQPRLASCFTDDAYTRINSPWRFQ
ncbi:CoA transferase [Duganella sp. FT3S]|uniref:CoA transferase n=1 Tax=Rugamonas fusca TaxID=2758568 RepID=A0A7W2EE37_9BURK|nr:CoA transferase [Rugamonas fusca]MBA5604231.1 CoA transferase [Rugamonas fusca]